MLYLYYHKSDIMSTKIKGLTTIVNPINKEVKKYILFSVYIIYSRLKFSVSALLLQGL